MPFISMDTARARVLMLNDHQSLQGAASVLLGLPGDDDLTPCIGQRKLSNIRSNKLMTPSGRFIASLSWDVCGVACYRYITSPPFRCSPRLKAHLPEEGVSAKHPNAG